MSGLELCKTHDRLRCGECRELEGLRAELATERAANATLLQGPAITELRAKIQTLTQDASHWKHEAARLKDVMAEGENWRFRFYEATGKLTEAVRALEEMAENQDSSYARVALAHIQLSGNSGMLPDTSALSEAKKDG